MNNPGMLNIAGSFAIALIHVILTLSSAGWSSPVARRAHNPKVVGSNPAPATKFMEARRGLFLCGGFRRGLLD